MEATHAYTYIDNSNKIITIGHGRLKPWNNCHGAMQKGAAEHPDQARMAYFYNYSMRFRAEGDGIRPLSLTISLLFFLDSTQKQIDIYSKVSLFSRHSSLAVLPVQSMYICTPKRRGPWKVNINTCS